ncbi:MAG: A/G-specific adenine glycosylase [Candidatus Taylorbacteria bacterium]|nr:A/G-specific adenine glycosylase [Candidatus Taylorbacteria bacterium]
MLASRAHVISFQKTVWAYYKKNARVLPWRKTRNPYRILVSEIMLQQTQVDRVIPFYTKWIRTFPDWASLNKASLRKVLSVWQGLGYNRRALALKRIAKIVTRDFNGALPHTIQELDALPGIGEATAKAITVYAWNKSHAFIETNIRTVFIHHFFTGRDSVSDEEILTLVSQTLPEKDPRFWYAALMDYGSFLKKTVGNTGVRSVGYVKQSRFKGSVRELRGAILKLLTEKKGRVSVSLLAKKLKNDERVREILARLEEEGFVAIKGKTITLAK